MGKREKLCFTQFSTRMSVCLIASGLFDMFTQSVDHKCLKNVIHQIDSKNEWLLLSASFAEKFGLVFISTLENVFFRGFLLKPTERA